MIRLSKVILIFAIGAFLLFHVYCAPEHRHSTVDKYSVEELDSRF